LCDRGCRRLFSVQRLPPRGQTRRNDVDREFGSVEARRSLAVCPALVSHCVPRVERNRSGFSGSSSLSFSSTSDSSASSGLRLESTNDQKASVFFGCALGCNQS